MKKLAASLVVLAIALIAAGAYAFSVNVPGAPSEANTAINKTKDIATSEAMTKSANDKIRAYNCSFKGETADIACANGKSFQNLVSELKGLNKTGGAIADKNLKMEASVSCPKKGNCSDRSSYVRRELEKAGNWWNVNVQESGKGNTLRITAM